MKRSLIFTVLILCSIHMVFASFVTNTNQSALFYRLLSRNHSTDIDATYYNPAGLTQLSNGWHIALHNQTIFQEKTVINEFPFLNNSTYIGEVNVPVFPNFYMVYKKDNLALSFGFGPNAGGGTADFSDGLPSFEAPISLLPYMLTSMGLPTTKYSADIAFKGTSVFYGFQLNASYAVNEVFSVAAGARYIQAVNKYEGGIKNIMINPTHPLINPNGSMLPAAQFFNYAGLPAYAAMVGDKAVDVKQIGSAITPLLSVNVKPNDRLNIGIKYEFNTNLELENETTKDDTGMFPDGEKFRNDIPAILSCGIEYSLLPELRASFSYNLFFDKNADWGGREELIDSNTYDFAFGIEYDLTDTILISTGYLRTQFGMSKEYQTDFSHDLTCNTFGLGARFKMKKSLDLDIGGIYVNYLDDDAMITYENIGSFRETYKRSTWCVAIGLGYHF